MRFYTFFQRRATRTSRRRSSAAFKRSPRAHSAFASPLIGISLQREREGSKRNRQLTLESSSVSSSASSVSSSSLNQNSFHEDDGADDITEHGNISSALSSAKNTRIFNGMDDTDDQDDISALISGDSDSALVERIAPLIDRIQITISILLCIHASQNQTAFGFHNRADFRGIAL
jgi:hypothetical protein